MSDDSTSSPMGQRLDPLPDWISSDLLDETKSVWQLEYGEELTTAEAVNLLQVMAGLFEFLTDSGDPE
jgi:hypothetical protein